MFGSLCFASTLSKGRNKFAARSRRSVFLGCPMGVKGYKLLDLHTQEIFISWDVIFYEHIFPFKHLSSTFSQDTLLVLPVSPDINLDPISGDFPIPTSDHHSSSPSRNLEQPVAHDSSRNFAQDSVLHEFPSVIVKPT